MNVFLPAYTCARVCDGVSAETQSQGRTEESNNTLREWLQMHAGTLCVHEAGPLCAHACSVSPCTCMHCISMHVHALCLDIDLRAHSYWQGTNTHTDEHTGELVGVVQIPTSCKGGALTRESAGGQMH